MKFRRRRRLHRSRPHTAGKGDWVVGLNSECPIDVIVTACEEPTQDPPLLFALVDSTDIADKQDKLTVVRTVGEIPATCFWQISNGGTGPVNFHSVVSLHEGIYVSTVDPLGNVLGMDPALSADLESDSWMWLRKRILVFSGKVGGGDTIAAAAQMTEGSDPMGPHIDLRVKRKLEQGFELVYSAHATVSTQSFGVGALAILPQVRIYPSIRLYCRF